MDGRDVALKLGAVGAHGGEQPGLSIARLRQRALARLKPALGAEELRGKIRRFYGPYAIDLASMEARRSRVELHQVSTGDRGDYLAATRASLRLHRPWVDPPRSDAKFAALVRRAQKEEFEPMIVRRHEDGAIVGFFNLSQIIRGDLQSAFLGFGAVSGYEGRGYMTEGLVLVLRRAFTELRLHRVEANIQPANTRSIALVRRCGFVREGFSARYLKVGGRWRDHEHWATYAELWRRQQRRS